MADLHLLREAEPTEIHVLFFHGLGADYRKTWSVKGKGAVQWPTWLAEDVPGVAISAVSYDAARTRWRGNAMELPERALHILELILANRPLAQGTFALVGHSMGGLIIKQLLRLASDGATDDPRKAEFIRRVRRVVFIATPHRGSALATNVSKARLILRPSAASVGLVRNDPHLIELNRWYRRWSENQQIAQLALRETKPTPWLGVVVTPESSDVGNTDVIAIDADHVTITQIADRNAPQYLYLREFLERRVEERRSPLTELSDQSFNVRMAAGGAHGRVGGSPSLQLAPSALPGIQPTSLVESHVAEELGRLRKIRFFDADVAFDLALRLGQQVLSPEGAFLSAGLRARTLAWCARLVASTGDGAAASFLAASLAIERTPDGVATSALSERTARDGLAALGDLATPLSRTAAFALVQRLDGSVAALRWLAEAGLSPVDFDAEGKFLILTRRLELEHWDEALVEARLLEERDYEVTPALFFASALAELGSAVPPELRQTLLAQPPFEAKDFPLASDSAALAARRTAQHQFERSAGAAESLGLTRIARYWGEFALWLALRDHEQHAVALEQLRADMRNPALSLRRLYLAIQFGIRLDIVAVEAEIDRQTTLTGGASPEAAFARFTLAFLREGPAEVAAYIDRHREQLLTAIPPTTVGIVEVEMLARAGRPAEAQERIEALSDQLAESQKARLLRIVVEAVGGDPTEARAADYAKSGELTDLVNLVRALEERGDWERLLDYGLALYERTRALPDAERYVNALSQLNRSRRSASFLRANPDLVHQSEGLRLHWAWTLFREGALAEARAELIALPKLQQSAAARNLRVNLAIFSGEWEELLPLIEEEWLAREKRSAADLLRIAQLAAIAGSPRTHDLVSAAVAKEGQDPSVLAGAYSIAVESGWEHEAAVGDWLHGAAALSGDDGPMQRVTLQELIQKQPEWEAHQQQVSEGVAEGRIPMFLAAKAVRRTLLEIFLLPALANRNETDPRRRPSIPAFTGSRGEKAVNGTITLDVTALLTLGYLGLLGRVFEHFAPVRLAHSTLAWLFSEKQRVRFHQPSRIAASRELRDLLATGQIKKFDATTAVDDDLAREVGQVLAAALTEAGAVNQKGEARTFVVRSFPVHRVGSLMEEIADLGNYERHLVGCRAVIDKLVEQGQLSEGEEIRAKSYLSLQEGEWPYAKSLPDDATLILDDVAVSHFQHLGLLPRLHRAGITAIISENEVSEADALLAHEGTTAGAAEVIEEIRREASAALRSGRAVLEPAPDGSSDADLEERGPTFELLRSKANTIVIDDRALNRHEHMDDSGASIANSLDLIYALVQHQKILPADECAARTKLRQSGFQFVALSPGELSGYMRRAVDTGSTAESTELRAVRESVLRASTGPNLIVPLELDWVLGLMRASNEALKAIWSDASVTDEPRKAASDWLVSVSDLGRWLHRFAPSDPHALVEQITRQRLTQLIALQAGLMSAEATKAYLGWLDESQFQPLEQNDPFAWGIALDVGREFIRRLSPPEGGTK